MNLFTDIPEQLPQELFETLHSSPHVNIERIVSRGHITPKGEWYDQGWDEWVLLIQGEARIAYADKEEQSLQAGDYVLIKAHAKHRVSYTSSEPEAIWLAIHIQEDNVQT
jgi:cupin 2 domain-containing protein